MGEPWRMTPPHRHAFQVGFPAILMSHTIRLRGWILFLITKEEPMNDALPEGMTGYEIAVNVPGYSPESYVSFTGTLQEARLALAREIEDTYTIRLEHEEAKPGDEVFLRAALVAASTAEVGQSIVFGDYAHTIVLSDLEE
jgi:hypothetical protein